MSQNPRVQTAQNISVGLRVICGHGSVLL